MIRIALLLTLVAGSLAAQDATVYFDHRSPLTGSAGATTYVGPGGDTSRHLRGYPRLVAVPRAGRFCVQVVEGNPLLYSYTMKAETLKVEQDSALKSFVAALGVLLADNRGFLPAGMPAYRGRVEALAKHLQTINMLKWRSDTTSFTVEWANEREVYQAASAENEAADKAFADNEKGAGQSDDVKEQWALLRVAQLSLWKEIVKLNDAFVAAGAEYARPQCVDVADRRLKATFSIAAKSKPSEKAILVRPVGDNLVSAEVEPTETSRIAVGTGLLYGNLDNVPSFSLQKDSVVAKNVGNVNVWRPSLFLMLRPWNNPYLWATAGVGTGKDLTMPDQFYGLVTRLGGDLTSHLVTFGLGAIRSAVPSDLKTGSVGQRLPSDVPKLEDNIAYQYKWGVGVVFSLAGLELKTDKK